MISNPIKWYTSGSKEEVFTHEGGSTLYHFSCYGLKGFEHHVMLNVIFFANSLQDAKEVLAKMLQAQIKGAQTYESNQEEVRDRNSARINMLISILDQKDDWQIVAAPTNQFYKVGWASNDTIL